VPVASELSFIFFEANCHDGIEQFSRESLDADFGCHVPVTCLIIQSTAHRALLAWTCLSIVFAFL
jgi:hypothetical protein